MCSEKFKNALIHRRKFEMEHRLRTHAGEYHWCVSMGQPYSDRLGEFAGYLGFIYDISERKLAEEVSQRYQLLSENARDIILFIDDDACIIEANNAAVKTYGYSREELLNLKIMDLREKVDL